MLRPQLISTALSFCFAAGPLVLGAGCEDVETHVYATNLPQKSVEVDVQEMGGLSEKTVRFYQKRPEVDAVLRLPKGSCPEACHFVEVTAWVRNKTDNNMAPPVVRLSSPEGRPPRAPVPLGAHEISVMRTGRIRLLVELWPEEVEIDVDVSGSTFFEVFEPETGDKPDDVKKVESGGPSVAAPEATQK